MSVTDDTQTVRPFVTIGETAFSDADLKSKQQPLGVPYVLFDLLIYRTTCLINNTIKYITYMRCHHTTSAKTETDESLQISESLPVLTWTLSSFFMLQNRQANLLTVLSSSEVDLLRYST